MDPQASPKILKPIALWIPYRNPFEGVLKRNPKSYTFNPKPRKSPLYILSPEAPSETEISLNYGIFLKIILEILP